MTGRATKPPRSPADAVALADRLELLELYARYTHAFDHGDAAGCAALFTADGAFTPPAAAAVVGRAALERFFATATARSQGSAHLVTDIVLDAEGPYAVRGTARILAVRTDEATLRLLALGTYRDSFRHDGRHWLFAQRSIDSAIPAALSGAVLTAVESPAS